MSRTAGPCRGRRGWSAWGWSESLSISCMKPLDMVDSLGVFDEIPDVYPALQDETTLLDGLLPLVVDHLLVPEFVLGPVDFQHNLGL